MNKHRKLKNRTNSSNLKTQLRRKRHRKHLRSMIIAAMAVIFLLIVFGSVTGLICGFATMGHVQEESSFVYSEGSLSFMPTMYDPVDVNISDTSVATVSTSSDLKSASEVVVNEEQDSIVEWAPTPVEAGSCPYVTLTSHERDTFAILIYLESGAEPLECQYAVASVVLNRYTTGNHDSLLDVIYAKGQFQPAYLIDRYSPRAEQLEIVDWLCTYGPTIPEYVTYFRDDHYHTWSSVEPWKMFEGNLSNMYFSYSPKLYEDWLADR